MTAELNTGLLLSTMAVGLSCALTCGQISVFFLGSWISASDSNSKKGFFTAAQFLVGKSLIYVLVAGAASIVGTEVQKKMLQVAGAKLPLIFNVFLIVLGGYFIIKLLKEGKCKKCDSSCSSTPFDATPRKAFLAGMAYGITPCYPMSILMLNASMLSLGNALILGLVFSATSFINPLLILGMISGKISQQMRKEISSSIKYFQIGLSVVFVCMGAIGVAKGFQIM